MQQLLAGLIGGLLIAVSAGVLVTLLVSGDEWSRIIAGAVVMLVIWIPAMLLGFTTESSWLAWRRIISVLLVNSIFCYFSL